MKGWREFYFVCNNLCILLSCCWSSVCCCISGKVVVVGYCVNFWVRVFGLFRAKLVGNLEGREEENDGGVFVRLGVAMENMGVDRLWFLFGVCKGKLFREIIGVDRGWFLCFEVLVILWRLGCNVKNIE